MTKNLQNYSHQSELHFGLWLINRATLDNIISYDEHGNHDVTGAC